MGLFATLRLNAVQHKNTQHKHLMSLCWVPHFLKIWVPFCWMSLCRVSWRQLYVRENGTLIQWRGTFSNLLLNPWFILKLQNLLQQKKGFGTIFLSFRNTLYISMCFSVCLSLCHYVHLFAYFLLVSWTVCLFVFLFICLSLHQSVYFFVCLFANLFV